MRKKGKKPIEVFSLSFLDVISCGFGAVILLLVLSLALEPTTREKMATDLAVTAQEIEAEREDLDSLSRRLRIELREKEAVLAKVQSEVESLESTLDTLQDEKLEDQASIAAKKQVEERLQIVFQTLDEEMRNLLRRSTADLDDREAAIGGIPVDSEYIIFIIDTSGSMLQLAWPMVVKKLEEVLSVYPEVKGLQIMNDMGVYMFPAYAGQWIPDTPSRRTEVIRQLRGWQSFSNSSPVEGIQQAIRTYLRKDQRVSLYVFGDDFSSGNINAVLNEVERINRRNVSGETNVRIHAFGFPVLFSHPEYTINSVRFSHLMRLLAEQNNGSFVGLTRLE
ncbi:MAG: VWA domain-containing protein [Puniceicoccaceae bacterium]